MVGVTAPSAIDSYLDRLLLALRGRPGDVRRILAETEDHLRDAAAAGVRAGLAPEEAERAAVERFGPVAVVARRSGRSRAGDVRAIAAELTGTLGLMAAVGLLTIGASGLVSLGMRALWGDAFVAGDPAGVTYTAARCDDFREYHPEAATCQDAAAAHHADEVVDYRLAAGVLGVAALAAAWWLRRRRSPEWGDAGLLPDGVVAVAGLTAFGGAGALLTVQGLGQLLAGGGDDGPGQWLSGGVIALAVAAWFGVALLRLLVGRVRMRST
jgi:hypothetical protein